MKLHDIPPPPPPLDGGPSRPNPDLLGFWRDYMDRHFAPYQEQFAQRNFEFRYPVPPEPVTAARYEDAPPRPDIQTVPFRTRTRNGVRVGQILARLDQQYMVFRRSALAPRDLVDAGFVLMREEQRILMEELPFHELERHGFSIAEGTESTYRGYPLFVV